MRCHARIHHTLSPDCNCEPRPEPNAKPCRECKGAGTVPCEQCAAWAPETCPECLGAGCVTCGECNGEAPDATP